MAKLTADDLYLMLEDNELYISTFFSHVARQKSADFHQDIDRVLWSGSRFKAIKVFRDGAKTTRVGLFLSKRVAFGFSRTIVYVSKSQALAIRALQWLKKEVETNELWAATFGLRPGTKWSEDEIEIINDSLGITVRIIAVGITGQLRGINVDTFRPDTIICDDVDDESTTSTLEQITKTRNTFFGGLVRMLAPATEVPDALICIIQTPLDANDLVETCCKDPLWETLEISCFDENGESTWPTRHPTATLQREKQSYVSRNMLHIWLREMEVRISSPELAQLKGEWFKKYDILPERFDHLVISVDPASSESVKADWQVVMLQGSLAKNVYCIQYHKTRGQDIEDSVTAIFDLVKLVERMTGHRPTVVVETVGYQRQLKRSLERKMKDDSYFFTIKPYQDKRSKEDRVIQSLGDVMFSGRYFVNDTHVDLIEQVSSFPNVPHDDVADAAAIGVDELLLLSGSADIVSVPRGENIVKIPYQSRIPRIFHGRQFRSY